MRAPRFDQVRSLTLAGAFADQRARRSGSSAVTNRARSSSASVGCCCSSPFSFARTRSHVARTFVAGHRQSTCKRLDHRERKRLVLRREHQDIGDRAHGTWRMSRHTASTPLICCRPTTRLHLPDRSKFDLLTAHDRMGRRSAGGNARTKRLQPCAAARYLHLAAGAKSGALTITACPGTRRENQTTVRSRDEDKLQTRREWR
jgi:hypothetical protein